MSDISDRISGFMSFQTIACDVVAKHFALTVFEPAI